MSKYQQQSMAQEQFLTVASNILYKTLVEASRTAAKNVYNAAREGKRVALITVRMEDGVDLRFDLALDCTEYRGKLSFGAFRSSVSRLIALLVDALKQEKKLSVFTDENDASTMFGLPAFTEDEGKLNCLMMAVDTRGAGAVLLKLMYMDPDQFIEPAQPASEPS
jgi:hypothetical protein